LASYSISRFKAMDSLPRKPHGDSVLIIYQGIKTLNGSDIPFELCVIDHFTFGVIEILAYDRDNHLESSRVYADCSNLQTHIKSSLADYLSSRILLVKYRPNQRCFEVTLIFEDGIPAVVCTRPSGLKAFKFSPATIE
jgi:hypothetical protein